MKTKPFRSLPLALTAAAAWLALAGCAQPGSGGPSAAELDRQAAAMMRASFRDEGIAKVDRLNQDPMQAACSSETPPSPEVAKQLEAAAAKTIQMPPDGKFLGDWKTGETLAQSGRGMTWTDNSTATSANGGSCYNCHQIDRKELSFGTIGPSLWNYGKLRGVKDPSDPAARPMLEYTWGKLWNAKATSACSNMPRFGHLGLLDVPQMQNLMALLLDPASPVNQ